MFLRESPAQQNTMSSRRLSRTATGRAVLTAWCVRNNNAWTTPATHECHTPTAWWLEHGGGPGPQTQVLLPTGWPPTDARLIPQASERRAR